MTTMHRELAAGRWFEQMANIGSEIERTISWRGRNEKNSTTAFKRGLELLDLTPSLVAVELTAWNSASRLV